MGPCKLLENELMALECMLTRGVLQKQYTPGSADATLVLDAATEIEEVYYDTRLADYKNKYQRKLIYCAVCTSQIIAVEQPLLCMVEQLSSTAGLGGPGGLRQLADVI